MRILRLSPILLFLIVLVFSSSAQALLSVRVRGLLDDPLLFPSVQLVNDGTLLVRTLQVSGDGTSASAPIRGFVPVIQGAGAVLDARRASLYGLNANPAVDILPEFTLGTYPGVLRAALEVTITVNEPATHYLYAVTEGVGGWRVVQRSGAIGNGINRSPIDMDMTLQNLCEETNLDCDSLSSGGTALSFKVYYFLSQQDLAIGTALEPGPTTAPNNNGVYYTYSLSSRFNPAVTTKINESFRGDSAAVLNYTSTANILDLERTVVFKHSTPPATPDLFVGEYTDLSLSDQIFPNQVSGVITVQRLPNNEESLLSVALLDQYNFVTRLSAPASVTPLQIEELLAQETCFIVTAGFAREHPVIHEMKQFRDQVLMPFEMGRSFVAWYYQTSPYYAAILLESTRTQSMVRGLFWFVTMSFSYLGGILLLLGFASTFVIIRHFERNANNLQRDV
jgi:hypothetical protein